MFEEFKNGPPRTLRRYHVGLMMIVVGSIVSPPLMDAASQVSRQREAFDAASIRISTRIERPSIRWEPSGIIAVNTTALDLIKHAFDISEKLIVGDIPSWVRTTRFELIARSAKGPLTRSQILAMTKALLEDRFHLEATPESTSGPIYALVLARSDGRVGRSLRPSDVKCEADAPLSAPREGRQKIIDYGVRCGFLTATSGGSLTAVHGGRITMRELAGLLSRVGDFDRPIVDQTSLSGEFDMAVLSTNDIVAPTDQARFLIALREQAGLVLRGVEGTYEVLKVRRIERPSPN